MCDDVDALTVRGGRRRADRQRLVGALIVAAQANWLEDILKSLYVRSGRIRVERLLILPRFDTREMSRPAHLLEQVETDGAVLLPAGVAILLERGDHRRPR